jgi:hypothetical protein
MLGNKIVCSEGISGANSAKTAGRGAASSSFHPNITQANITAKKSNAVDGRLIAVYQAGTFSIKR